MNRSLHSTFLLFVTACCWLCTQLACNPDTAASRQMPIATPASDPTASNTPTTLPMPVSVPNERKEMEAFCKKTLERLWKASDYWHLKKMPTISVERTEVCAASYGSNLIVVEMKAIEVCKSLGPARFEAALAQLIAHELAHFYQCSRTGLCFDDHRCSYLSFNAIPHARTDLEEHADLSGAFNLYLAHFQLDSATMATLIDALYTAYRLPDDLPDYPTKSARQKIAQKTLQQLSELVILYENATFFAAIGDFDAAIQSYETVLPYYQGKEIYANLGVTEARKALFLPGKKDTPLASRRRYLFPFETDWNTLLRQETLPGIRTYGSNDTDELLADALLYLDTALLIDPHYEPAALNRLMVLVLREKSTLAHIKEALDGFSRSFGIDSPRYPAALLTYAVACAAFGKNKPVLAQADSLLNQVIAQNPDEGLVAMARFNLAILQGKRPPKNLQTPLPGIPPTHTTDLCYYQMSGKPLGICHAVQVEQLRDGSTMLAWKHDSKQWTVIQRMAADNSSTLLSGTARSFRLSSGAGIQVEASKGGGARFERNQLKEYFRFCRK